MMMSVLEAGGEELETSDETFDIYTEANDFKEVRAALAEEGYHFETAELTLVPTTYTNLTEEDEGKMERLIELLEDKHSIFPSSNNSIKRSIFPSSSSVKLVTFN